jgi:hypothetical protein
MYNIAEAIQTRLSLPSTFTVCVLGLLRGRAGIILAGTTLLS